MLNLDRKRLRIIQSVAYLLFAEILYYSITREFKKIDIIGEVLAILWLYSRIRTIIKEEKE